MALEVSDKRNCSKDVAVDMDSTVVLDKSEDSRPPCSEIPSEAAIAADGRMAVMWDAAVAEVEADCKPALASECNSVVVEERR